MTVDDSHSGIGGAGDGVGDGGGSFEPQLSARELRKIKYYEEMFAKMAQEERQRRVGSLSGSCSSSAPLEIKPPRRAQSGEQKRDCIGQRIAASDASAASSQSNKRKINRVVESSDEDVSSSSRPGPVAKRVSATGSSSVTTANAAVSTSPFGQRKKICRSLNAEETQSTEESDEGDLGTPGDKAERSARAEFKQSSTKCLRQTGVNRQSQTERKGGTSFGGLKMETKSSRSPKIGPACAASSVIQDQDKHGHWENGNSSSSSESRSSTPEDSCSQTSRDSVKGKDEKKPFCGRSSSGKTVAPNSSVGRSVSGRSPDTRRRWVRHQNLIKSTRQHSSGPCRQGLQKEDCTSGTVAHRPTQSSTKSSGLCSVASAKNDGKSGQVPPQGPCKGRIRVEDGGIPRVPTGEGHRKGANIKEEWENMGKSIKGKPVASASPFTSPETSPVEWMLTPNACTSGHQGQREALSQRPASHEERTEKRLREKLGWDWDNKARCRDESPTTIAGSSDPSKGSPRDIHLDGRGTRQYTIRTTTDCSTSSLPSDLHRVRSDTTKVDDEVSSADGTSRTHCITIVTDVNANRAEPCALSSDATSGSTAVRIPPNSSSSEVASAARGVSACDCGEETKPHDTGLETSATKFDGPSGTNTMPSICKALTVNTCSDDLVVNNQTRKIAVQLSCNDLTPSDKLVVGDQQLALHLHREKSPTPSAAGGAASVSPTSGRRRKGTLPSTESTGSDAPMARGTRSRSFIRISSLGDSSSDVLCSSISALSTFQATTPCPITPATNSPKHGGSSVLSWRYRCRPRWPNSPASATGCCVSPAVGFAKDIAERRKSNVRLVRNWRHLVQQQDPTLQSSLNDVELSSLVSKNEDGALDVSGSVESANITSGGKMGDEVRSVECDFETVLHTKVDGRLAPEWTASGSQSRDVEVEKLSLLASCCGVVPRRDWKALFSGDEKTKSENSDDRSTSRSDMCMPTVGDGAGKSYGRHDENPRDIDMSLSRNRVLDNGLNFLKMMSWKGHFLRKACPQR